MGSAIQLLDYEVLHPIGQGGYGVVYMARSRTDTLRAVKVVQCDHEGYEREVKAIQQYENIRHNHPGLLKILHVGMGEGFYYYVMPLADSINTVKPDNVENYRAKTLSAVMERGRPLPLRECVETTIQLLEGVEVLHKAGMVHRDIKPANILYFDGRPVLGDMGLLTQAGPDVSRYGTRGYEAPEGPGHPRADLYAVGMLLYHLSTGMQPSEFPNLPSSTRGEDEVDFAHVNRIFLCACEMNFSRRYPSARSMVTALHQVLHPPSRSVLKAKARRKLKLPALHSKRDVEQAIVEVVSEAVAKIRRLYDMNSQWLTAAEMAKVGGSVKRLFRKLMGHVPTDINSSCLFAEAIVEDVKSRKRQLFDQAFKGNRLDQGQKNTVVIPQWLGLGKKVSVESLAKTYTFRDPDVATKTALKLFTLSLTKAIEIHWDEYQAALLKYSGPPGKQLSACAPPSS
jgi:serine/threonine protein kinase